jgi:putative transcriptional regulator
MSRGGKRELRTTRLPARPRPLEATDVRRLRDRVNASQAVFASYLNVSPQLVRAWEAGRRRPEGAALRLLEIAEWDPHIVFGPMWSSLPASSTV